MATSSDHIRATQDRAVGYALLRLAIGMSMLGHGLIRIVRFPEFHAHLVGDFAKSPLPAPLVSLFADALPFVEFAIGALLLVGALTRAALIAGGALMTALVFGSSLIERWEPIAQQLGYAALFAALLAFLPHNRYSVDALLARSRRDGSSDSYVTS
ncbi:MAG: DoxX family protein [Segniliparus sp.]|uniref:DoxX family protein n=1 Tax=Segniliparus sp. TaxID=2804064 RepID=UPI003F307DC1